MPMHSADLPDFLFPPWHVADGEEVLEAEVPDCENSGAASHSLGGIFHFGPKVMRLARRMLNERHLEKWNVEVQPVHIWKCDPDRYLDDEEPIGWCQYTERTIVVGLHEDLSEANYKKTIAHLIGNVVAAKSATALGKRLLRRYGLNGWKLIVTRNLGDDTAGLCRPVEKEIYLDPFKLSRPRSSILNTLLHEIAHALVGKGGGPNGHGPKWQKKARELGVSEADIAWHAKFGS